MKVAAQDGSPNRKVYTITDSSRKVFLENLRKPFTLERQEKCVPCPAFLLSSPYPGRTPSHGKPIFEIDQGNAESLRGGGT